MGGLANHYSCDELFAPNDTVLHPEKLKDYCHIYTSLSYTRCSLPSTATTLAREYAMPLQSQEHSNSRLPYSGV